MSSSSFLLVHISTTSSSNARIFYFMLFSSRSLMRRLNIIGLRTDPWARPMSCSIISSSISIFLFVIWSIIAFMILLFIFIFLSFSINFRLFTLSIAFWKSRNSMLIICISLILIFCSLAVYSCLSFNLILLIRSIIFEWQHSLSLKPLYFYIISDFYSIS